MPLGDQAMASGASGKAVMFALAVCLGALSPITLVIYQSIFRYPQATFDSWLGVETSGASNWATTG